MVNRRGEAFPESQAILEMLRPYANDAVLTGNIARDRIHLHLTGV